MLFRSISKDNPELVNSYWMYSIVLERKYQHLKEKLINKLSNNHIETRPIFYPIHSMPPYKKFKGINQSFEISTHLSKGGLCLPSSPFNTIEDIDKISKIINLFFKKIENK